MGKPPYEDADSLELMRADADQVDLAKVSSLAVTHDKPALPGWGFDVPSGAADLGGRLHVYLD
jgi:hypothetical protein